MQQQKKITAGQLYTSSSTPWINPLPLTGNGSAMTMDVEQVKSTEYPAVGFNQHVKKSRKLTGLDFDSIFELAKREFWELRDVEKVEKGFLFINGRVTDMEAIVLTMVSTEAAQARIGIPETFFGVAVEVLGPGIAEVMTNAKNAINQKLIYSYKHAATGENEAVVYPTTSNKSRKMTDTFESIDYTPVLSTDQYFKTAISIVKNAQKSILIENLTITGDNNPHAFAMIDRLLTAILEKQKAGLEVKIICRSLLKSDAKRIVMRLKDMGFNMDCVRLQNNGQARSLIVDGKVVLIGGQDLSEQCNTINRNPGILVDNAGIGQVYSGVFNTDWALKATNIIESNEEICINCTDEERRAANKQQLTWSELLEVI